MKANPQPLLATSSWRWRQETLLDPWFEVAGRLARALGQHASHFGGCLNCSSLSTKPHHSPQLPRGSRDFVRLLGFGSPPEEPCEPLPRPGRSQHPSVPISLSGLRSEPQNTAPREGSAVRRAVWQRAPAQAKPWPSTNARCFLPAGWPRGVR